MTDAAGSADRGGWGWPEPPARDVIPPQPSDPRLDEWLAWLEAIDTELVGMWGNREVWRTLNNMIRDRKLPASHVFDYLAGTYATTQAVAVRRQIDEDERSVSLLRLMQAIKAAPEVLTVERYVCEYPPAAQWLGRREFAEKFGGSVGIHVDPALVTADIDLLKSVAAKIKTYVDKHVAHYSETPMKQLPNFNHLDQAVDVVGDLFRRYTLLLTQSDRKITPIPQHDWLAPFRVPWLIE